MMSPEEWTLVEEIFKCVRIANKIHRIGIAGADGVVDQSAHVLRFDNLLEQAKAARAQEETAATDERAVLQERIAALERELEEAKAKLPRQIRVAD